MKRGESVEEEDSGETDVADALANAPEVPQGSNLVPTSQPLVSQSDPSLFKIIEQMTIIMGQLSQAAVPRENYKSPAFKTASIKAPDLFDGTQAQKLRVFIQSCQLIFHNDPANFFSDRKEVLYSTLFLTGRAGKWIEPYLLNISKEDPSYLLNNWQLFETKLFTLFGDPNEIPLTIMDSNKSPALFITHYTKWVVDFPSFPSFEWDFFIIDSSKGEDLILGYDCLYHFNTIIDCKNGLITYYSSHKDSCGIKSSACNSLATAVNSVALVGELKTPSLPSCHLTHYFNQEMRSSRR
ncbi:hypothetical protein O181_017695 [Austropuccinia psidii MF-1]|uniref:DUF4939 domain-containing protein n=1 Tax=Austropuccinia psidii MF-1 TaxID=1389203 RepID=A0A9Q3C793_9BASI|nr:hypothetical protein [Austropuccinia psidii MF-1]